MACETGITFLAIENNNLIIHSDPWKKSERDSIRNSCNAFLSASYDEICWVIKEVMDCGVSHVAMFFLHKIQAIDELNFPFPSYPSKANNLFIFSSV